MPVKHVALLAIATAFSHVAHAQISLPATPPIVGAQPVATTATVPGLVTLNQAAAASPTPASNSNAATSRQEVPAHEQQQPAAQAQVQLPSRPAGQALPTLPVAAATASTPNPAASTNVVPPLPPVVALPSISPRQPDIALVRISERGGVMQATMTVKGLTRSGLTVGSKVLKQVISEFRDDGLCLDASLHKPKCATFLPFQND